MSIAKTLNFGHSPDIDDAYMLYGLAAGIVSIDGGFQIHHVIEEIDRLNLRARAKELEVTAISAHAYAYVADSYAIMATGASVARGYGPCVVSRTELDTRTMERCRIAVPGELTTAHLLAQIFLPKFEPVFLPFRDVEKALAEDRVDAAILIHEGQVLWRERGYHLIADLGRMFETATGCPVPLGLDVVRRDLGHELGTAVRQALRASILAARDRHDAALDYALNFGNGIDRDAASRFIRMYVNDDTLDLPDDAMEGLHRLYTLAAERGLIDAVPPLDIIH